MVGCAMHLGIVLAFAAASAGPVGAQTIHPSAGCVSSAKAEARGPVNDHEPYQQREEHWSKRVNDVPAPTSPIIATVKSSHRSESADDTRSHADDDTERSQKDLKAQQEMASAAWGMLVLSAISFFASGFGLYLVGRTLKYTRDAAEAARDAVSEAKRATEAANRSFAVTQDMAAQQLRAYVTVVSSTYLGHINGIGDSEVAAKVRIKNAGQTPAYQLATSTGIGKDHRKPSGPSTKGSLGPGIETTMLVVDNRFELTSLEPTMYVFGSIEYTDCFGKSRKTAFRHRYVNVNGKLTMAEDQDGSEET
jgi:hypothetical protein